MSNEKPGEQLHVGLLSLNKKQLISPDDTPTLFTGARNASLGISVEQDAFSILFSKTGIRASSERILQPLVLSEDVLVDGYLARESAPIDIKERELNAFSDDEVLEYILSKELSETESHFLRQIYLYMNGPTHPSGRASKLRRQ